MSAIIEKMRQQIEAEYNGDPERPYLKSFFTYHVVPAVEFAKTLANKLNADKEIVELSTWAHDIGIVREGRKDHNLSGAKVVEEILLEWKYPAERIARIKHCVLAHSSSSEKEIKRETVEADCVAYADRMATIAGVSLLFAVAFSMKMDLPGAIAYVRGEVEESWKQLPQDVQEIVRQKYVATMFILTT